MRFNPYQRQLSIITSLLLMAAGVHLEAATVCGSVRYGSGCAAPSENRELSVVGTGELCRSARMIVGSSKSVVEELARHDPQGAAAWLAELPENPSRDRAIELFVWNNNTESPDRSLLDGIPADDSVWSRIRLLEEEAGAGSRRGRRDLDSASASIPEPSGVFIASVAALGLLRRRRQ